MHQAAGPASAPRTGTHWMGQSFSRLLESQVRPPRGSPRGPYPVQQKPQSSAWVISTLTNLGTFSKAMWKDRCTKLHDPHNNTSSPISDLDADIANCYANPQDLFAADRQLLNRPISKVLKSKRAHKTKFLRNIRRAHRRFLAERLNRQYTIRHFFDPSVLTVSCAPRDRK